MLVLILDRDVHGGLHLNVGENMVGQRGCDCTGEEVRARERLGGRSGQRVVSKVWSFVSQHGHEC